MATQHISWLRKWMDGGIGSIDARIEELTTELGELERVRKALAPVIAAVEKKKTVRRVIRKSKRRAQAFKSGKWQEQVLGVLTTTGLTVRAVSDKLNTNIERIYGPLHKLARDGKAVKSMKNGVQVWRRTA